MAGAELLSGAFWAEQIFGFVGLALLALSWQFRAQRTILGVNAAAFLFFAAGLHAVGATVGMLMMLFAALMAAAAMFKRASWVMLLLVLGPAALGAFMAERAIDFLPVAAHVTGGVAFFRKTTRTMRRWAPVGTVLWAVYNVIVGAWGQFLADLMILASMGLGAWRNR